MVIQRNATATLRGSGAIPHDQVEVTTPWSKAPARTTADAEGRFSVPLVVGDLGGPATITVTSGDATVVASDVYAGDVWLCSGQSNMEWVLKVNVTGGPEAIKTADIPLLRHIKIERMTAATPQATCRGTWKPCSPATAGEFTAAGFFFGRALHQRTHVPIGLLDSSFGGTPAEAWTSGPALAKHGGFDAGLKHLADSAQPPRTRGISPAEPSSLYNGMIAPLLGFPIRGVIWYQGESNVLHAAQYRTLFPALIADWRAAFQSPDLPFYFVQIAPYEYKDDSGQCAELREAQEFAWRTTAHCGMVGIGDVGNPRDIHPSDKLTVGLRLAAWAMRDLYGAKNTHPEGPRFKAATRVGATIQVSFDFATALKTKDGKPPANLEICGADHVWKPARGVVDGAQLVVSSPDVPEPVAARYCWRATDASDLFNEAGLPLGPFRTDGP